MTPHQICKSDALIFAVENSAIQAGLGLIRLVGDENCFCDAEPQLAVGNAGEALRLIYRHDPRLIVVCVDRETLDKSVSLIGTLHSRRPELPLLAVSAEHDEITERAVRTAGASCYFALDSGADLRLLRQALQSVGRPTPLIHRHRPRVRGRPLARIAPS